jgi:hypothetical protein
VWVTQGLWDSYEQDAFPRDRRTRRFLDPRGSTRCTTRESTSRWWAGTLRGNLGLPVPENRYTRARRAADSELALRS